MNTNVKDSSNINPDFIIVGAAKAGTTSLHRYLNNHSQICMSSVKEPNYFSADSLSQDDLYYKGAPLIDNISEYNDIYSSCNHTHITGEASVSYLFYPDAAENIFSHNPDTKIIIVLRNPINRAYSHYMMDQNSGYFDHSLEDIINNKATNVDDSINQQVIKLGMYCSQIKRYLNIFPQENILILFQEEMNINTQLVLDNVFDFLNVESQKILNANKRHHSFKAPKNKFTKVIYRNIKLKLFIKKLIPKSFKEQLKNSLVKQVEKPKMSNHLRKELARVYKDDVKELSQLLQKDLAKLWNDFNE